MFVFSKSHVTADLIKEEWKKLKPYGIAKQTKRAKAFGFKNQFTVTVSYRSTEKKY